MRLQSLRHLLEVVQAVARPQRILVLGSGSLLASYPELGEKGQPLELTTDSDFILDPANAAIAESLQLAVGRDSAFMLEFGYYADIMRPQMVETLPFGWQSRLVAMAGYPNVFALNPYDLALVKLVVGREKDLDLLRAMLKLSIVEPDRLRTHYQQSPLGEHAAADAGRNLTRLLTAPGGK